MLQLKRVLQETPERANYIAELISPLAVFIEEHSFEIAPALPGAFSWGCRRPAGIKSVIYHAPTDKLFGTKLFCRGAPF
jgi:hypothetical protein